jgi:DNA-directed RNA polymerase specialized sigma24 family protein
MPRRLIDDFDKFVADATPRLQRALVAHYGIELGREAASDAIAYAWEHRHELADKTNPLGYLFRVGQTSVRRLRRQRRLIDLPPESHADTYRAVDSEPGLPDALARLSDDQRAAVLLVHAHAYSYAEAAELLDVPVTTLRNHIHRGMTRLRTLLEQP